MNADPYAMPEKSLWQTDEHMEYRQGQRMPLTRSGCLAERWYPIWSLITKQWQTGSLRWIL